MTAAPNGTPYKICPKCQTAAPISAPQCLQCGRVYRTQFTPRVNTTQVFTTPHSPMNISYPVGQTMSAQTQKPTDKGNWFKGCIGGCVGVPIVLLLMLSTFGSLIPKRSTISPASKNQPLEDVSLPTTEEAVKQIEVERREKDKAEQNALTIAQMKEMVPNYKTPGEALTYFGEPDTKLRGVPKGYPDNYYVGADDSETWLYFRSDGLLRVVFQSGRLLCCTEP